MTGLKLQLKAYIILLFHCRIAWCSDNHVINMILFFYCSIAWCSDNYVTNMILFFYCSIAWCSDTHVTNMILFFYCSITPSNTTMIEQNYVCLELLFQSSHSYVFAILQVLISASTKPSYNTTKEQNRISHKGIRTPCYTATEEQHYVSFIVVYHGVLIPM
jgi:hypothetical protein